MSLLVPCVLDHGCDHIVCARAVFATRGDPVFLSEASGPGGLLLASLEQHFQFKVDDAMNSSRALLRIEFFASRAYVPHLRPATSHADSAVDARSLCFAIATHDCLPGCLVYGVASHICGRSSHEDRSMCFACFSLPWAGL